MYCDRMITNAKRSFFLRSLDFQVTPTNQRISYGVVHRNSMPIYAMYEGKN